MYTLKLNLKDSNEKDYSVTINSSTYVDNHIKVFAEGYQDFCADTLVSVQKRGDFEDVDLDS